VYNSTFLIRKFTATLLFIFIFQTIHAQQWLGVSGSNYGGTHSVYNNPANITDSRYKLYVNLVANDVFITNNYVGYDAPFSIFKLLTNTAAQEYRNSKNVIVFKNAYYDINTDGGPYHLNALDDLRGPSFLYTLNSKRSFGLLTRIRTVINFTGASLPLANLVRLGTDTLLLKNQDFMLSNSTLNINNYAELGVSYGQILKDEDEDFIKVGVTLKRVVGIYNAHINIQEANYKVVNDPAEPKKQLLKIDKLKAEYGYTTEDGFRNTKPSFPWIFGNQSAGSGWGLDLGIVYEYRPEIRKYAYREKGVQKLDPSKNKYEFKVGISILDIGGLNYNNPFYVRNWDVDIQNKVFNSTDVSQVEGTDDAFKRINQVVGLSDDKSTNNFSVGLPTVFQVNLDYHLRDKFYINSLWVQGLRGSNSLSMKMPSSLSVTPRWESKWIEVGMPFALLDNYSSFTFGLGFRTGPLFFGTDNLGSFLNINRPRGTDLYVGLSVPIFNRPPTLPNACFYEKGERKGWKFWKKRK
jgi:Family of unknown function (DUF5723)